ncbi:MAG: transporter substrate-binding domain-containing protein, partial [Steroidobacteraceae bacterium]
MRSRLWTRSLALAGFGVLLLAACSHSQSALQRIRASGELRVVTLNDPTSYYLGAQGPQGFEYRLARAFASQLQVRLVMEPMPDAAAMRSALIAGRADMAAAQITPDAAWLQAGQATQEYDQIPQLVVQSRSKPLAHDLSDLGQGSIVVRDASPQLDTLRVLKARDLPDLSWIALKADQRDPIEAVTSGDADFAIVDANEFEFARHLYPDAVIAFTLSQARPLQWVVRAGDLDLLQAANGFFVATRASGQFAAIAASASAETEGFDYLDAHRFQSDIATRLPQLQAMFEEAAQATGLDWRLLAAVGYQES